MGGSRAGRTPGASRQHVPFAEELEHEDAPPLEQDDEMNGESERLSIVSTSGISSLNGPAATAVTRDAAVRAVKTIVDREVKEKSAPTGGAGAG